MSNDNGKNPQPEYPQLIFKAELIKLPTGNLDVKFTCNTKHIPTLDTVMNELNYHIIEMRAMNRAQKEMAKQSLIQKANQFDFKQFLKRRGK